MPIVKTRRRSERVLLRMMVTVTATGEDGRPTQANAETQVVNVHGGLLKVKMTLSDGQAFLLRNPKTGLEEGCRVVRSEPTEEPGVHAVGFSFDRAAAKFWPIVFPPEDWTAWSPQTPPSE